MQKSKQDKDDGFFSWNNLRSLFSLLAIIFAVRWSIVAPYHVPTPSMEPSIKVGDRVIANHLAYQFRVPFTNWVLWRWSTPQKGDIIVFDSVTEPGINLVKRVVAVGGDKIELRNEVLHINGVAQSTELVEDPQRVLNDIEDSYGKKLLEEQLAEVSHYVMWNENPDYLLRKFCQICNRTFTIPEGSLFVMGDNRDNSKDSRYFGIVELDKVYGKAARILWSMYFEEGSGLSALTPQFRWYRFGSRLQ